MTPRTTAFLSTIVIASVSVLGCSSKEAKRDGGTTDGQGLLSF